MQNTTTDFIYSEKNCPLRQTGFVTLCPNSQWETVSEFTSLLL